jgi:hypothetical protein
VDTDEEFKELEEAVTHQCEPDLIENKVEEPS